MTADRYILAVGACCYIIIFADKGYAHTGPDGPLPFITPYYWQGDVGIHAYGKSVDVGHVIVHIAETYAYQGIIADLVPGLPAVGLEQQVDVRPVTESRHRSRELSGVLYHSGKFGGRLKAYALPSVICSIL